MAGLEFDDGYAKLRKTSFWFFRILKYLVWWMAVTGSMALLGVFIGLALGSILVDVSLDYVYVVGDFVAKGFRTGLVLGAWLCCCAWIGERAYPSWHQVLKVGVLAWVGIVLTSIFIASSAYLLQRTSIADFAGWYQWRVDNPNRVAFCMGMEKGAEIGFVIVVVTAGAYIRALRMKSWRS